METNTPDGIAGSGLKHRMMRNVSILIGLVVIAVFGLLTAIFGLTEGEATILSFLLVIGLVPPNMFLYFIVHKERTFHPK